MSTRFSFLFLGFFTCSTYADLCTPVDIQNCLKIIKQEDCNYEDGEINCESEECKKQIDEFARFQFPGGCTIGGGRKAQTFFVDKPLAAYNDKCGTNVVPADGSGNLIDDTIVDEPIDTNGDEPTEVGGAHGYSAAHYVLVILVPMALLYL